MRALEPGGELREAALGEGGVGSAYASVERAADARPHRLGQMLEDVAALVDLAAMDERGRAAVLADRLAQARPAVDDEEHRAVEIEPALAQVGEQRLAHRRVLRGPLAQREDVLVPWASTPKARRITWSRKWRPSIRMTRMSSASSGCASHVVSCARVSATKRRDTLLFETARSGARRAADRARGGYLRVVTPDRDRFERVGVERVAARGVREARQCRARARRRSGRASGARGCDGRRA